MPVSRFWREQVVEHRSYWGSIDLVGVETYIGRGQYSGPRCNESVELFLLRLARTHARPIDVTIGWVAPTLVGAIVPHLPHIRHLQVVSLISRWEAVVHALCATPAPMLESFRLSFHYRHDRKDLDCRPLVPHDLFAGRADLLKHVHLWDIGFSSTSELPAAFANITSLYLWITRPNARVRLPNIFRSYPRLRRLEISGYVALSDEKFWRAETWSALDELAFARLLPEEEVLNVRARPLRQIPRITFSSCGEATVVFLAEALGARLSATFPWLQPQAELGEIDFDVDFRPFGDTSAAKRTVRMHTVSSGPRTPSIHAITAFQNVAFSERIVELSLFLENWRVLVGQGYITELRALERLVFMVHERSGWTMPSSTAGLSCPRLQRVVLRRSTWSAAVAIDAASLVEFTNKALQNAHLPVALEADGVALRGSCAQYETMANTRFLTDASTGEMTVSISIFSISKRLDTPLGSGSSQDIFRDSDSVLVAAPVEAEIQACNCPSRAQSEAGSAAGNMALSSVVDLAPEELLLRIFNFFELAELVILMPVARRWNSLIIDHRTYWSHISLGYGEQSPQHLTFFCLRLARSASKPTDVSIYYEGPAVPDILLHVAKHLSHIQNLRITTTLDHSDNVFAALDYSAPLLQYLSIQFLEARAPRLPLAIPTSLLNFDSPSLRRAFILNAFISTPIPPALRGVEKLGIGGKIQLAPDVSFTIPDVFTLFPALSHLILYEDVTLDASFWNEKAWANIDSLALHDGRIGRVWHQLGLPIRHVPFVAIAYGDRTTLPALADHLDGALRLAFMFTGWNSTRFVLTLRGERPALERQLSAELAELPARSNIWARVASIALPAVYWDAYVPFFGLIPALEDLVLLLPAPWDHMELSAPLSCPMLKRLTVRSRNVVELYAVDIGALATLISAALREAPHPLELHFQNVVPLKAVDPVTHALRSITINKGAF
ncbi:hypothetical protein AURDEDRAFT_150581 [Auricularia subglabra TFB-10046 SS5]|nr:hypothetical protein AURDEDRAFT_150581 [Auricularia subglabra TFB-10046 SS5]